MGESHVNMSGQDDLKVISLEEFNKHSTSKDLWLCIRGKVIDVTKYQEDHPGSDTILQEMGGKDATTEFDDVGHTVEAKGVRDGLVIGHIPEDQLPKLPGWTEGSNGDDTDASGGSAGTLFVLAIIVAVGAYAYTQLM